jgi:hypothetical protein
MTAQSLPAIEQMKELALPAPVTSYWPQTWGWLVLLLVLLALAGTGYWQRRRRWQRARYRREALLRLTQLRQQMEDPARRVSALRELPELLKRVALSMPTQQACAALHGEHWQAFLQRHAAQPLPAQLAGQLAHLAYAPAQRVAELTAEQREQLLGICQHWIEAHHVAA